MNSRGPIEVELGNRSYAVRVEALAEWASLDLPELDERGRSVLLVTDTNVGPLWGERVRSFLEERGFRVVSHQVNAGEATKNVEGAVHLWEALRESGIRRDGWVAALGGGIVGDLAGWAAASYLRGIAFIQIPTSLLAMADSSVGGKVGINAAGVKNLVGAFHQPRCVLTAPEFLSTLPDEEFANGMAEVVKAAIIGDPGLFALLETEDRPIWNRETEVLDEVIRRSVRVKAGIVGKDEREAGVRKVLNLGHTLGHAIESAGRFTAFRHGEAVAIGMVAACQLSVLHGVAPVSFRDRVESLLTRHRLPTRAPDLSWDDVVPWLSHDKKARETGSTFILTGGLGDVRVQPQVSDASIREAAAYVLG